MSLRSLPPQHRNHISSSISRTSVLSEKGLQCVAPSAGSLRLSSSGDLFALDELRVWPLPPPCDASPSPAGPLLSKDVSHPHVWGVSLTLL